MIELTQLPHERRHFVHKRIGRAVKGFVSSGFNPLAAAGAFIASDIPVRRPAPRSTVARPSIRSAAQKERGRAVKAIQNPRRFFGPAPVVTPRNISFDIPCLFPFRMFEGKCVPPFLGDRPGPDDAAPAQIGSGSPPGEAVMGRHGAGMVPGSLIVDRAVCIKGMVVGDDGICYNRSQLKNSERMWPRGRRPLLTGGDMRAISIASRAASRLTRTATRLQEIGLIKKPIVRKRLKKKN